ncbi:MAG: hypothetical protein JSR36_04555 [Proteobacteria bacterium]|nr:hypothetical protein [Pseudomonadota bacterium]
MLGKTLTDVLAVQPPALTIESAGDFKRRHCVVIRAGFLALGLFLCVSAWAGECTREEAIDADVALKRVDSWQSVSSAFGRFSKCDDGQIAEQFSARISRLLADHWEQVPELVALSRTTPGLENFVVRHLDETIDVSDVRKIEKLAWNYCPKGAEELCKRLKTQVIQPDPVYRETEVRQSRPRLNGEVFDPQESDPALRKKFALADRKAERVVGNVQRESNFILHFWDAKKRILRDQFGIQWKTPAELNPRIKYDGYGPKITAAEEHALRALVAPRLSTGSEEVRGIDRSFEGLAEVWTSDSQTREIGLYTFEGHDDQWTFREGGKSEPKHSIAK